VVRDRNNNQFATLLDRRIKLRIRYAPQENPLTICEKVLHRIASILAIGFNPCAHYAEGVHTAMPPNEIPIRRAIL
jgi:hypothetical protein